MDNKKSEDSYFVCFLRYRQTAQAENTVHEFMGKVLNLWHENLRCNMDVLARGIGRAV